MGIKVLYDYQAFSQMVGGVSRYHIELLKHLPEYEVTGLLPCIITENAYIRESQLKYRTLPPIYFQSVTNPI